MEKRLAGIPCVIVRVDDILVTGANDAEHLDNLAKVLEVLKVNGMRLKKSKCFFMMEEIIYLGFKISKRGIETIDEKVKPILEALSPKDKTQLKSFLGMLQYYHRHLPNLSSILEPLHELLRNDQNWTWGQRQHDAFEEAKKSLASSALLVHYDPQKPITLAVDASPYGLGAVLSHVTPAWRETYRIWITHTEST